MPHHRSAHHYTEILPQVEQYLVRPASSKVFMAHDKSALPDANHLEAHKSSNQSVITMGAL